MCQNASICENFTLLHIFWLDSRWWPADSKWISAVHPPFFLIFYLVVNQPNVSLESSWTPCPPSGLHGLRTQSTSQTPHGVQQEFTIAAYLLLLLLHKEKRLPWLQIEHLITWEAVISTINHYTTTALLATQFSHTIYPPTQLILRADQTCSFGHHAVFFHLPTTTHCLSSPHYHLIHETHCPPPTPFSTLTIAVNHPHAPHHMQTITCRHHV